MTIPRKFRTKAVGVTFAPGYPDNLFALEGRTVRRDLYDEGAVMAKLVRVPDSEHDPNTIAVEVEGIGHVGHVARPIAARLAPELDAGDPWECEVVEVKVSPENLDNPGVDLEFRRRAGG